MSDLVNSKTTTAFWTRPWKLHTFVQCSSLPIGLAGDSVEPYSPPVTTPPGRLASLLDLGATLPGVPLYRAFGFREIEPFVVTMSDGVTLDALAMERSIVPPERAISAVLGGSAGCTPGVHKQPSTRPAR
jgi:hypothetical protein